MTSTTVDGAIRHPAARLAEGLVIGAACLGPWMFGAVDAWAELILLAAIVSAALLSVISGEGFRQSAILSPPSLAIGGLIALASLQATPLPGSMLRVLDPAGARLRSELLPDAPDTLLGDAQAPVPLPPATLSQAPGLSVESAGRLAAVWLLFQVAAGLGRGPGPLRRFGWAIAINGALLALFALVQALNWNGKIYWVVPSPHSEDASWSGGGPFVCHSHLAEYLNLGLGVALGVLLGSGFGKGSRGIGVSRDGWVWSAYLAGVLALGVVTSNSRGGVLAMLAAGSLTVLGLGSRSNAPRFLALLLAAVGLLGVYLLALGDSSPYVQRLWTILDPSNQGYSIRAEVWRDVLSAWRSSPLFGTGLGAFEYAAARTFTIDHRFTFGHAENVYVEMLVEGGLTGLGLAIVMIVGVARGAGRALASSSSPGDRALVLGAAAGVLAVLLQCLGDFGLYVPGVLFPVVVLCAHLTRMGDDVGEPRVPGQGPSAWRVASLGVVVLVGAWVIWPCWERARIERMLSSVGLPMPNSESPSLYPPTGSIADLTAQRDALEKTVPLRQGWVEGALRLGLTELALYRATAEEWLAEAVENPAERAAMADPLWLLELVRQGVADGPTLAEQEPIQAHLFPAARAFLEARRRSPLSAASHAQLGALRLLFDPSGSPRPDLERAIKTAGADAGLLLFAARVAWRSGDKGLAADCWRGALRASADAWPAVFQDAVEVLSPEQILEEVIPPDRARHALSFSERPGLAPSTRDRFLKFAAEGMPQDLDLPEPERLHLEARAWSGLGDRPKARARLEAALAFDPSRFEYRRELIEWLLAWGDAQEAHNQALVGKLLSADHPEMPGLLERTTEALARGAEPR